MNIINGLEILFLAGLIFGLTPILGRYFSMVFRLGDSDQPMTLLKRIDASLLKWIGISSTQEMNWKTYTVALLQFHLLGFFVLFLMQFFQASLPLNPSNLPNVSWHLAFNTAISFVTNTNWQSYAGETTLSQGVQMLGLGVQNFLSAAVGMSVLFALIRGLIRKEALHLGSFWADMWRIIAYILLPLSIVFSIGLVSQGVIQNFSKPVNVTTLEGRAQILPQGPVASQIAIKQLGTNGGGYFNANSSHPYENPTPLSNFIEMLAIILIPSALVWMFGDLVGNRRHGWIIWCVMATVLACGIALALYSEFHWMGHHLGMTNWEGKETRFGISASVLWAGLTTAASNGSINAAMSSLSPIAGGVALFNMMLGEIIFGGVGSGLYGMILFIILTLFLAGLMVGRTPEYLGKKLGIFEMKMVVMGLLLPNAMILIATMMSVTLPQGLAGVLNQGPHGFSEILYAVTSATANNGSAFAGLTANTPYYNLLLGVCMGVGRLGVIIPCLAIAGSLATQKRVPPSSGTLSTDNGVFGILLLVTILLFAGLTFLPALCLGPIVEHCLMMRGVLL